MIEDWPDVRAHNLVSNHIFAAGLPPAPIKRSVDTSAETMVVVRIARREVIARFEPTAVLSAGQPAKLAVDLAEACLFNPESEALI